MKNFTLIVTEDIAGNLTINTENDGFTAFELLGFLELKQQDLLEQIRHPDKFVRRFPNGEVKEETDDGGQ